MLITPGEGLWEVTCGITRGMKKKKKKKKNQSKENQTQLKIL